MEIYFLLIIQDSLISIVSYIKNDIEIKYGEIVIHGAKRGLIYVYVLNTLSYVANTLSVC